MRLALVPLVLITWSVAQTRPDFSGIFARTATTFGGPVRPAPPRIIEVKQTAEEIVVTAMQNGETAVASCRFNSKNRRSFKLF
jgi:hypothetical protein